MGQQQSFYATAATPAQHALFRARTRQEVADAVAQGALLDAGVGQVRPDGQVPYEAQATLLDKCVLGSLTKPPLPAGSGREARLRFAEVLLDMGANPDGQADPSKWAAVTGCNAFCCDTTDQIGAIRGYETPLMVAAEANWEGMTASLCAAGADVELRRVQKEFLVGADRHAFKNVESNALTAAIMKDATAAVRVLLQYGADLDAALETINGQRTPRAMAEERGLPAIMAVIAEFSGPGTDVKVGTRKPAQVPAGSGARAGPGVVVQVNPAAAGPAGALAGAAESKAADRRPVTAAALRESEERMMAAIGARDRTIEALTARVLALEGANKAASGGS